MKRNTKTAPQRGAGKNVSFSTRSFGTATVMKSIYRNGDGIAVELVDEDGESIAVLSVNMPECSHLLGADEFFVKTWSENEELAEDARASGVFHDTGRESDGFLKAKIWKFA